MKLEQRVEQAIRRQRLLQPGERVAVACSGGADSVALLLLLNESKARLGLRLLVAHLNHGLRGEEADADEAFVRQLAERLELEYLGHREDVAARTRRQRLNLEEAGRQARMEFFASILAQEKADVVAMAHTLDDQAETVLSRLVRGAGTRGLAGIYPTVELQRGRLVRPLLGIRRAVLREYLAEREQAWREDSTNLDRRRLRNRIRLELLPQLNGAALEHLARLADHARQEDNFWAAVVEARFRQVAVRKGERWELPVSALVEAAPELGQLPGRAAAEAQRALARRLLRRVLRAARGDLRQITQTHVESVLRLAEDGQSGQRVELPGVLVERVFDRLVFCDTAAARKHAADYELQVKGPATVRLPGGGALRFKLLAVAELESGYNDFKVAADAARIRFPLRVRTWRPGDRFRPAGVGRRKKLKTLFQQQRVPAGERPRVPVVLCGEEIVWVPKLGVAADFTLRPDSRAALLIEERAEE